MIKILVVDDQQLLRRGLRLLLETVDDLEVVAEAAEGAEALAMIARFRPDVVLADARMPGMDGLELLARSRERFPAIPMIVLTTFDDEDVVLGSLGAGASGFLLKDISTDWLADAVRAVHRGEMVIDPRVAKIAYGARGPSRGSANGTDETDPLAVLTRTERMVARHVAEGRTNAEIAAALVIAEGTVKNNVSSLLRKLRQRDRTALALLLYRAFNG